MSNNAEQYTVKTPEEIALNFSEQFQKNYPKRPLFKMMDDLCKEIKLYSSELIKQLESETGKCMKYQQALQKVNAIRNSIIGMAGFNWSEHAYPLVAALNEAGFQGMDYPEANLNFRTMLERTLKAEKENKMYTEALTEIVNAQTNANTIEETSVAFDFLQSSLNSIVSKFQPKKDESHDEPIKER